jgi:hypothetical protein
LQSVPNLVTGHSDFSVSLPAPSRFDARAYLPTLVT